MATYPARQREPDTPFAIAFANSDYSLLFQTEEPEEILRLPSLMWFCYKKNGTLTTGVLRYSKYTYQVAILFV